MTQALNTWEKVAGHYGLTADDLAYIMDNKLHLETVKEICEYWLFCFENGFEMETFKEAFKAFYTIRALSSYELNLLIGKEVDNG